MGPTGNIQGSIKVMCMKTRKKIVRKSFTRLPMPEFLIKKVGKLAKWDRADNVIVFGNGRKEIYDWENEEYNIDEDRREWDTCPYPEITAEFSGVELADWTTAPVIDDDDKKDENKEADELEINCDLGETPQRNSHNEREDGIHRKVIQLSSRCSK